MKPWDAQGPYEVVLEWAPGGLATLPLFAVAFGMYAAPKIGVNADILSAYGTSALKQFSIPDLATLLASDGVLRSAMHVVLATALLLLLAFGALRPGRVPNPFKPHWAVQTRRLGLRGRRRRSLYSSAGSGNAGNVFGVLAHNPKETSDLQDIWQLILPEIDDPGITRLAAQSQTWVGAVFMFLLKYWVWLNSILFAWWLVGCRICCGGLRGTGPSPPRRTVAEPERIFPWMGAAFGDSVRRLHRPRNDLVDSRAIHPFWHDRGDPPLLLLPRADPRAAPLLVRIQAGRVADRTV